jgi:pimeloyl-ACP methyl ester carboxylesterase
MTAIHALEPAAGGFAPTADGARICWAEAGAGDAVLLVMGFSYTKEAWHRVVPGLAQRHRVIYFDNRGVGQTVTPKTPNTIELMAADAIAVLDAAGEHRVHVYGASMGGGIAQEIALSYPDRVRSLVLGCTASPERPAEPNPRLPLFHPLNLIPMWFLKRKMGSRNFGPGVDREKVREDQRILRAMRVTRRGLIQQARAMAMWSSWDRLPDLKVPTLVIHGTADQVVPYEMGKALAARIPGARLLTVEGAGHNYVTDATDETNNAVLEFFAAH